MPQEKSAGAVLFHLRDQEPHYLLLHYPSETRTKKEYWDFPKGHLEPGETEQQAATREVEEETGIEDVDFVEGFRETIHYFFQHQGKRIFKTVVFYLGKISDPHVRLSFEHIDYKWLPFEQAIAQLKFANAKQILTKAHDFLSARPKKIPT